MEINVISTESWNVKQTCLLKHFQSGNIKNYAYNVILKTVSSFAIKSKIKICMDFLAMVTAINASDVNKK
jgi:hypothetical protein